MTSLVHKIPQKPIATVKGAESGIKSAEGRNVYYSPTDLLALTVMEYLLSMGLSFEVSQEMLETLKAIES
jgi:DNA-binding transcriptional MerR regulator